MEKEFPITRRTKPIIMMGKTRAAENLLTKRLMGVPKLWGMEHIRIPAQMSKPSDAQTERNLSHKVNYWVKVGGKLKTYIEHHHENVILVTTVRMALSQLDIVAYLVSNQSDILWRKYQCAHKRDTMNKHALSQPSVFALPTFPLSNALHRYLIHR